MLIIFNWITIQSIILHSIFFNYGPVYICKNSNKLARISSQSKVENKIAPYRTAAMIWRPEERQRKRRRLEEEKYVVWNSNSGWDSFRTPSIGHFLAYSVSYEFLVVVVFNSCCTASLLHKGIKNLVSSNHHVSAILFNHVLSLF